MPRLPRASGKKHLAAFKRAGWIFRSQESENYPDISNQSTYPKNVSKKPKDFDISSWDIYPVRP